MLEGFAILFLLIQGFSELKGATHIQGESSHFS